MKTQILAFKVMSYLHLKGTAAYTVIRLFPRFKKQTPLVYLEYSLSQDAIEILTGEQN